MTAKRDKRDESKKAKPRKLKKETLRDLDVDKRGERVKGGRPPRCSEQGTWCGQ